MAHRRPRKQSVQVFKDAIHGSIELDAVLVQIIDTPEFQRLRKIKQLGGQCFIYPSAVHTRFEHSIGVCYIAGVLLEHLQNQQKTYKQREGITYKRAVDISKKDALCVKIAALCHDIGHGPFSHLYDVLCKNTAGFKEHEYRSADIVKKILKRLLEESQEFVETVKAACYDPEPVSASTDHNNEPVSASTDHNNEPVSASTDHNNEPVSDSTDHNDELDENDSTDHNDELDENDSTDHNDKLDENDSTDHNDKLDENDLKFIAKLITFSEDLSKSDAKLMQNWKKTDMGRNKDKCFLFEIVANGHTGIDVDKMDYFARDSHSLGLKSRFDWKRYVQSVEIHWVKDLKYRRLCTREKEALNLYELFHERNILHRTAYKHKTTVIVEYVLRDILEKCSKSILFKGQSKYYPIQECWKDLEAFQLLNDSVLDLIHSGIVSTKLEYHQATQTMKIETNTDSEDDHQATQKVRINIEPGATEQSDLTKARKELEALIDKRSFPKFIGSLSKDCFNLSKEPKSKEEKAAEFKKAKEDMKSQVLRECELETHPKIKIICQDVKFSYGKDADNPMDSHYFYSKTSSRPFKLPPDEVSVMIPTKFKEELVYYYVENAGKVERERLSHAVDKIKEIRKRKQA